MLSVFITGSAAWVTVTTLLVTLLLVTVCVSVVPTNEPERPVAILDTAIAAEPDMSAFTIASAFKQLSNSSFKSPADKTDPST